MDRTDVLGEQFEQQRPRLRAIAYRVLGSRPDADDAVQDAWLRLQRQDLDTIDNLDGWLTTVVTRISLNTLRNRQTRREVQLPDPVVTSPGVLDPAEEAAVADEVSLALLVVLDTLTPAERVAFVLHDVFAVSFDQIAGVLACSNATARQHASRARRRLRSSPTPDAGLADQRRTVDAFFAAARGGDLTGLVAVLDPQVLLRTDFGPGLFAVTQGAELVATRAATFASPTRLVHPVVVNGAAGVAVTEHGRLLSVMGFTVVDGQIAAIDVLADPERLATLPLDLPG